VSLRKYHDELGGAQHGDARLQWPGTPDGFPVLNNPFAKQDLKQDELDNIDLRYDFKSRMFELWDPAHKADFDDVNDKIVNGWYRLLKRDNHWDEEHKHFIVWLEWAQVYGMLPPKV
jgi:hypothetical protein